MPKQSKVTKPTLWVPKVVSYNGYTKRGYIQGGTKAFVKQGTRLASRLKREQKWNALRQIGRNAEFFIKPLSRRNKTIRATLEKYGIRTEKILQELGDGKALFQKEGHTPDSIEGIKIVRKNPQHYLGKIEQTLAKMILLEIYHGHPHLGNFAITKSGEVIVLDLGKATMGNPERIRKGPLSKSEENRLKQDLNMFCDSVSIYYLRRILQKEPSVEELNHTKEIFWNQIHNTLEKMVPLVEKEVKSKTKSK